MNVRLMVLFGVFATAAFSCQTAPTLVENTPEPSRTIAFANNSAECMREAMNDGCWFSRHDQENVLRYTNQCRIIESGSRETKVITWRLNDGTLSFMKTRGRGVKANACKVTRVNTGEGGTTDLAAKENKLFFRTNNGHVYYTFVDLNFKELLNAKGKSYSSVKRLDDHNRNIELVMEDENTRVEITDQFLKSRRDNGHIIDVSADKVVEFESSVAAGGRSPFRF